MLASPEPISGITYGDVRGPETGHGAAAEERLVQMVFKAGGRAIEDRGWRQQARTSGPPAARQETRRTGDWRARLHAEPASQGVTCPDPPTVRSPLR